MSYNGSNGSNDNEVIDKYVREAQREHFWGNLELAFQDGQLALIRREETIKIRMGNNRDDKHKY